MSNNYFASTPTSHVDVARYNDSMHIASASGSLYGSNHAYVGSENYMQETMSNMHALNFNDPSNIQQAHVYFPTLAAGQVPMPLSWPN